jgi:peptidoglycan/LPS O-acetylase OafA/YrhL
VKRIPSLDSLWAISILLVVLGHLAFSKHAPQIFWDHYANTGVRIFFVISGFLITSILCKEESRTSTVDLKTFYLRRAYRIFPAAFVFMLLMVIFFSRELHWYNIAAAFLYLANFDYTRPWIFGHLWSLGVEEQFYLVWPGILKRWYRHRIAILVGVMVLAPVGQTILYYFKVRYGNIGSFPGVAGNLAAGCLLAILAPRLPKINPYLALVMLSAVVFIPLFPLDTRARTLFVIFILDPILHLSIAGVLLHVVQVPYRILNWRPVSWLGKISYSLYLWQQPFCANPSLQSMRWVFLALVLACLSYYFVELPMLRRREKKVFKTEDAWLAPPVVSTAF